MPDIRGEFGHLATIRRVGDLGLRAAVFRALCLVVVASAAIAGDASPVAWAVLAVAGVGTYLSVSTNFFLEQTERFAREPLARWSQQITESNLGRMKPDVPGLLEAACYLPLVALGAHLLDEAHPLARLVAVAASLAWVASCVLAVFLDPSFYNPQDEGMEFMDRIRSVAGPIAAGIALLVVSPWTWEGDQGVLAAALCVSLAAVQLRIRDTDRLVLAAAGVGELEERKGRSTIAGAVHSSIGPPMDVLGQLLRRRSELEPELWEQYSGVVSGYDRVLALETELTRVIEWPGLLQGHLDRLTGIYQTAFPFDHPDDLMSHRDIEIAHDALHELATNAARAGARVCSLTLVRREDCFVIEASDDGRAVPELGWMRPYGGMRRLADRVRRTGPRGDVALHTSPKTVSVTWHVEKTELS